MSFTVFMLALMLKKMGFLVKKPVKFLWNQKKVRTQVLKSRICFFLTFSSSQDFNFLWVDGYLKKGAERQREE